MEEWESRSLKPYLQGKLQELEKWIASLEVQGARGSAQPLNKALQPLRELVDEEEWEISSYLQQQEDSDPPKEEDAPTSFFSLGNEDALAEWQEQSEEESRQQTARPALQLYRLFLPLLDVLDAIKPEGLQRQAYDACYALVQEVVRDVSGQYRVQYEKHLSAEEGVMARRAGTKDNFIFHPVLREAAQRIEIIKAEVLELYDSATEGSQEKQSLSNMLEIFERCTDKIERLNGQEIIAEHARNIFVDMGEQLARDTKQYDAQFLGSLHKYGHTHTAEDYKPLQRYCAAFNKAILPILKDPRLIAEVMGAFPEGKKTIIDEIASSLMKFATKHTDTEAAAKLETEIGVFRRMNGNNVSSIILMLQGMKIPGDEALSGQAEYLIEQLIDLQRKQAERGPYS